MLALAFLRYKHSHVDILEKLDPGRKVWTTELSKLGRLDSGRMESWWLDPEHMDGWNLDD